MSINAYRWYRTNHDAEYQPGDLIRYASGETALFMVESVRRNGIDPQNTQYYGQHCMGGLHGAIHSACEKASDADHRTWVEEEKWRKLL